MPGRAPAPVPPLYRHGEAPGSGWPLCDFMELGPLDSSVPSARYHTRHILREWDLAQLAQDAELLVAELVTNAVAATRRLDWPYPVRLWLLSDTASLLILVWDANPQLPVCFDVDDLAVDDIAESGRGLLLVEAISEQWDWYTPDGEGGKVVRALLTR